VSCCFNVADGPLAFFAVAFTAWHEAAATSLIRTRYTTAACLLISDQALLPDVV
jgi:hypothetical protein